MNHNGVTKAILRLFSKSIKFKFWVISCIVFIVFEKISGIKLYFLLGSQFFSSTLVSTAIFF